MLQLILISFKIGLNIGKIMQPPYHPQPIKTVILKELLRRRHQTRQVSTLRPL
jgi:hypothetical protein